jgi:DNA polymerase-4
MVDETLPIIADSRPLRYLYLDLNAYFASVEQQERPELRGRPVGVVPMMVDSTCILACSYEAKRCGVKTGTLIAAAREMCPGIELLVGRPTLYVDYHHRILDAVETVVPVDKVRSIDEMQFRLIGKEREPAQAEGIARRLKAVIREKVGDVLTCSIGVGPNAFLAKLGTELQKPDGLVILTADSLPGKLLELPLMGFTGINRRMAVRLNAAGIFSAADLCSAGCKELGEAFGSVVGERWWYLLRGYELKLPENSRKSLGHSHVLPPELRTDQGAREVLLRLLQKASARLRKEGLWASGMDVQVKGRRRSWHAAVRIPPSQDTVTFNEHFLEAWKTRDFEQPTLVGVTFCGLAQVGEVTPSLFDATQDRAALNEAVDSMNRKFGKNTIYLAGMEKAKNTAPERIAFQKTDLLSEGKDDNVWDGKDGPNERGAKPS